jgi:hypothetical protein
VQAGLKDNVLPKTATATVNFRILPGETSADCLAYIERACFLFFFFFFFLFHIKSDLLCVQTVNDPRVKVREANDSTTQPSPISPTNSNGCRLILFSFLLSFPGFFSTCLRSRLARWLVLQKTIHQQFPDVIVAPYLSTSPRHFIIFIFIYSIFYLTYFGRMNA